MPDKLTISKYSRETFSRPLNNTPVQIPTLFQGEYLKSVQLSQFKVVDKISASKPYDYRNPLTIIDKFYPEVC